MYLQHYDLTGSTAVVTGGGRGIGLAIGEALAEAGARVVVAEIDPTNGETAVDQLRAKGAEAEFVQLDVTKPQDVEKAAAAIHERHGGVDILVANAGIVFTSPAETTPDDEWLKVIDVNLNGVYWCNRAFGKRMLEAGKGSIVNLGSMSGLISNKPQPQAHYNTAKAAVHMLTKSLAGEWASRGVRVNAVAPTYISTDMTRAGIENPDWYPTWLDMTPMHRVGTPPEIASVVLFLASDASSLLTGSIIVADAGYTVW